MDEPDDGGITMWTLQLSDDELQLVSAGLTRLPYAQVAPLIERMKQQLLQQQSAKDQEARYQTLAQLQGDVLARVLEQDTDFAQWYRARHGEKSK